MSVNLLGFFLGWILLFGVTVDAVGIVRTATEREPLRNEVKQWSRGRRRNPGKPDQIVNGEGLCSSE